MPLLNYFPPEILLLIFEHLKNKKDLLQCFLVCRNWSQPAQQILYKEIIFNNNEMARRFIESLSCSTVTSGELVKSLKLASTNYYLETKYTEDVFQTLVQLCPDIQRLEFSPDSEKLWILLIQARKNGQWALLECLPKSNQYNFEYYASAALLCHNTLTHLCISDENPIYYSSRDTIAGLIQYNRLVLRIHQFSHLSSISITRGQHKMTILELDNILSNCPPFLKVLSFSVYKPNDRGNERISSKGRYTSVGVKSIAETVQDLSLVQPYSALFEFNGDNLIFTNDAIQYLMLKFPNLRKLRLGTSEGNSRGVKIGSKILDLTVDTITCLFDYLKKILYFDIFCNYVIPDDMEKMISKLAAVAENTNIVVSVIYGIHAMDEVPQLRICTSSAIHGNHRNKNCLLGDNQSIIVELYFDTRNIDESGAEMVLDVLGKFGNNTKRLYFDANRGVIGMSDDDYPRNQYDRTSHLRHYRTAICENVGDILRSCDKLETLILFDIDLTCFGELPELVDTNESIKTLEIHTALKINACKDQEYLHDLSICMPSLKCLVYIDGVEYDCMNKVRIIMPDNELENVSYEPFCGWERNSKKIYLNVKEEVENGKSYYYILEEQDNESSSIKKLSLDQQVYDEVDECDNTVFCIEIYCRHLSTFTIKLHRYFKGTITID